MVLKNQSIEHYATGWCKSKASQNKRIPRENRKYLSSNGSWRLPYVILEIWAETVGWAQIEAQHSETEIDTKDELCTANVACLSFSSICVLGCVVEAKVTEGARGREKSERSKKWAVRLIWKGFGVLMALLTPLTLSAA